MSYTLEARDGALYAKEKRVNEHEPQLDVRWYRLTTSLAQFVAYFSSRWMAYRQFGSALAPTTMPPLVFLGTCGWRFHRASAGEPEYTDAIPIAKPARYSHTPLAWRNGAWCREDASRIRSMR